MGLVKKKLGNTELNVTSLGYGCASLGNLYKKVDDSEARKCIDLAVSSGLNLFDTAPYYGLGLSERRVGDALRELPRSEYIISTKVGRVLNRDVNAATGFPRYDFDTPMPFDVTYDYTYDGIMRSYEDSIQRLGLASIDVLLVHDIGALTHGQNERHFYNQLKSSGYKALDELRSSKQIKAVGLGVNETEICERVMGFGQFDCFLLAGRYSLLEQEPLHTFLPKCTEHGASIILGGPYNSGILATGVTGNNRPMYNYEPAPEAIIERVRSIEIVCNEYNVNLAAAALQFPLAHQSIATVIPGMGSPKRVSNTLELFEENIPESFWYKLKNEGLIDENAPIPCGV